MGVDTSGGRSGGRGPAVDRLASMTQELDLIASEQVALQGIFDEAQKQAAPLVQQATDAQNSMLEAIMSGRDTAGSVQKLAAIRAQIKMVEADAYKQALSRLDDNQKKKARKLYQLMNGMFLANNWRSGS
jgi:hypothetical protein